MKKLLIISIMVLCAENLSAQTWAEWFRQKATQKKYLLQQIAALHVYLGYLSKGYSIAKDGLNTIKSIKNGDLLQHTNYFTSLVTVNPQIKRYKKVADIIAIQISIAKQSGNAIKSFRNNHHLPQQRLTIYKAYSIRCYLTVPKTLMNCWTLLQMETCKWKMMNGSKQ